jgi:hemolysin activation/secretion protein
MKWWIGGGIGFAVVLGSQAQAQVRPPQTVNPLQTLPQVQAPSLAPHVSTSVQARPANPRLVALLSHTITPGRFDVTGVHAVPFAEIAALFSPMTGKRVTVADLVTASARIAEIYKRHGYALSFGYIPAQQFDHGIVHVTVVEGYVAKVEVGGDAGNLEPRIRAIAARIAADHPLRQSTFERYLQVLGMLPGVTVHADVPAPTTTDGATRLMLDVQRKRLNATWATDFNHPGVQGVLTGEENGLSPLGEQISLATLLPGGPGDQRLYSMGYTQPIGSDGLKSVLSTSRYTGNPDIDNLLPAGFEHRLTQNQIALTLSYPLRLDNRHNLSAFAGIVGMDQRDAYLNTGNGATLNQQADLRVFRTGIDYTGADEKRVRKFQLGVDHGFDAWGAGVNTVVHVGNGVEAIAARPDFTRYSVDFVQSDTWPHHFGTVVSMSGQYSPDSLPSAEQISFGGQRYGLAYDPGETAGDSGWGGSLELNHYDDTSLRWLKRWTPYIVAQEARVYLNTGSPRVTHLGSAALGLRLTDTRHYTIDLSLAQPFGDKPIETGRREPRWNLAFSYQLR